MSRVCYEHMGMLICYETDNDGKPTSIQVYDKEQLKPVSPNIDILGNAEQWAEAYAGF